jgi:hypothetical protein
MVYYWILLDLPHYLWMIYGIDRFQTPLQRQYVHHFMDRHGVYKGDVPLRTTR